MRFISYARNLEDVMLWRALRHVGQGFYIDVGAGEPSAASVTRAFYERGWHGINVEPARARHAALLVARPADINLQVVAGAIDATVTFYDIAGSSDSTLNEARAQLAAAEGREVVQRQLTQQTLNDILARHAAGTIHFLKIDTAGGEQAVLAGLDLARYRPWIVLVAGSGHDAHLGAAGYRAAYRDGVNVYYVAEEQAALADALALPPSEIDRFHLREDHDYAFPLDGWRAQVAQLKAEAASAGQRAEEARNWAEARVTERTQVFEEREAAGAVREAALEQSLAAANTQASVNLARAEHTEAVLRTRSAELDATIDALLGSTSWRVTQPLRSLSAWLQRTRGSLRDLWWQLRHRSAKTRQGLRAIPRAAVKRVVRGIMARPKLFFFIRHHLGRHPRLVNWLRVRVQRTQAPAAAVHTPGPDMENLSAPARSVLADLRRSVENARPR